MILFNLHSYQMGTAVWSTGNGGVSRLDELLGVTDGETAAGADLEPTLTWSHKRKGICIRSSIPGFLRRLSSYPGGVF